MMKKLIILVWLWLFLSGTLLIANISSLNNCIINIEWFIKAALYSWQLHQIKIVEKTTPKISFILIFGVQKSYF